MTSEEGRQAAPPSTAHPGGGEPFPSGHSSPSEQVVVHFATSRRRFIDVPRAFRSEDRNWVPPQTVAGMRSIDRHKHPFFAHALTEFFVAMRKERIVGRISAARDHMHDAFHHDRVGFFGHFEAADELSAHALLRAAEDWLQGHEATELRGPVDLSTNYPCGVLIDGPDEPPSFGLPHHPPTYHMWLESYGLGTAKDLVTFGVDRSSFDLNRVERITSRIRRNRNDLRIRAVDTTAWPSEVDLLWKLYNKTWERNWGFVPMSKPEFEFEARTLRRFMHPELVRIIEVGGKASGFIIGVPDINPGVQACNGKLFPLGWLTMHRAAVRATRCRVVTFGVLPEVRRQGLELVLLDDFSRQAVANGFESAECGWIPEDNRLMTRPMKTLGAHQLRRYRIYSKLL